VWETQTKSDAVMRVVRFGGFASSYIKQSRYTPRRRLSGEEV
jgi:hypothetical protein